MKSINIAVIDGNLTRDAELRKTQAGIPVLAFTVAVNESVKRGELYEDRANYIDCTMFGTRAEAVAPYLRKGTGATVQGHLRWSQWEQDGQRRSKVEVIVDEIAFRSKGKAEVQDFDDEPPF